MALTRYSPRLAEQLVRDYPLVADKNWGITPTVAQLTPWLDACEYIDAPETEDGEYLYALTVHAGELGIMANPHLGSRGIRAAFRAFRERRFPVPSWGKVLPTNSAIVRKALRIADTVFTERDGTLYVQFRGE